MAALGVLLLVGSLAAVWWARSEYREWEPTRGGDAPLSTRDAALIYLRGAAVWLVAGVWVGAMITGPAMRLIMRLLAVTAGEDAQGVITEAEQIVGEINAGETFGLMVFGGILPALLSAFIYLAVRRWLPSGWAGGVVFGLFHLVVAATRVDPLRPGNPDFDIVGPGWLSVLTFGTAAVLHGVAVAAFANRYSQELPVARGGAARFRAIAPLALASLVLVPGAVLLVAVVAVMAVVVAGLQVPPLVAALNSRRMLLTARALGIVILLVAAPGCVAALADIATG